LALTDLTPKPVVLPDGIELNYVRSGSGEVVIFIHGAMGDWRACAPQWEAFTAQFDCISYSRRYSHPNPNPLDTRSHNALVDAQDLQGLMDALGVEKAILIGSSYGGFTALALAVRSPERVQAVVSVEAPMMRYALRSEHGSAIAKAFLEASAYPARDAFEQGDDTKGVAILSGGIIGKKPEDIPPAIMERRMLNAKAARSLALSEDEFPLLDPADLAALSMPVMLLSGAQTAPVHDAIFTAVSAAMPQAQAHKVDGAGHSVNQHVPEAFNRLVLEFLDSSLVETV
jgi:pimeloyl-ACP methyl ester carboxylesterase